MELVFWTLLLVLVFLKKLLWEKYAILQKSYFFPTITIWQLNVNFTYILNNYSFITFVENNIHTQDSWQVSWALGLTLYVGHLYGCDNNHGPFGPVRLWTPTPLGLSMSFVLLLLIAMTLDTNLQD